MTGLKEDALTPSRNPHLDQGTGVTREGPEFGVRIEESKCRVHGGRNICMLSGHLHCRPEGRDGRPA